MSDFDLWPTLTPPAHAVDVDLAPGIAVTLTPALAGAVISASPGSASAVTDGTGEAWLATGNGDYTVTGTLDGYTIDSVAVEVRDDAPPAALTATIVLSFVTVPTTVTVGAPFAVTVLAGEGVEVTLDVDSGPVDAAFRGALVQVAGLDGIATFAPLTLDIPGQYVLSATVGVESILSPAIRVALAEQGTAMRPAGRLVLTARVEGSPTLTLSNGRYASHPTDTPANRDWRPVLSAVSSTTAVTFWTWGGVGIAQPLGELAALNLDGGLDWALVEDWRDRRIELRSGGDLQAYAEHGVLASAYIDRIEADPTLLKLKLKPVLEYLDLPLTTRYTSANAQIDQRWRPVSIGAAGAWVRPILTDPAPVYKYDLCDGDFSVIAGVYEQGGLASYTATPTGFQLLVPPVGELIGRVVGQTIDGLPTDTLGRLVRWLVQRYPSPTIPIDTTSLDAVSAAAGVSLSWTNQGEEASGLELLQLALDTSGAGVYESTAGALRFARLVDPWSVSSPPEIVGLKGGVAMDLDRAPGLTTSAEIASNPDAALVPPGGYPGVDPAINDALSRETIRITYTGAALHPVYAREAGLRGPLRIIAADTAQAQAELNRVVGLYTRRWWWFRFRLAGPAPGLEPGSVRLLRDRRFGLAGGVPVLIASVRRSLSGAPTSDVIAWGTLTPP